MTERPTQVKIGPLQYDVEWMGADWQRDANLWGQHCPDRQVIRIADNMKSDQTACLFIHEVAHGLTAPVSSTAPLDTECFMDLCGYRLAEFWQQNPQAFRWWAESLGLLSSEENPQ